MTKKRDTHLEQKDYVNLDNYCHHMQTMIVMLFEEGKITEATKERMYTYTQKMKRNGVGLFYAGRKQGKCECEADHACKEFEEIKGHSMILGPGITYGPAAK